jgi:hypothetical protein
MSTESSQCQLIREALERGEVLTSMDALKRFGCFRLASRADDLRKEGLNIPVRQMVTLPNGKSVALYFDGSRMSFTEAVERHFPNLQGVHPRDEKGRFSGQISPETIHKQILPTARKRYEEGKESIRVIAKDMDIPWPTLYKKLRGAGVKMRHVGQQKELSL